MPIRDRNSSFRGTDLIERLNEALGAQHVLVGVAIREDYSHDEALSAVPHAPDVVVRPSSAAEVAAVVRIAAGLGVPVTARGSGTGLSGACIPRLGGILVSFERMASIIEIDTANHVAVVQPGVTLDVLDRETAQRGLVYPVFPGENSASLGGNVATNAGGMRAVKYGVTRHQVLGVEAVLGTGEVIRCGGKFVKATTGYDLTQLITGSEGTLAIVTEATLRLYPRAAHAATVLAPFASMADITAAVPVIVGSGVGPMILEYIDTVSMVGITKNAGLDLGIPDSVKDATVAYLVVVVEARTAERLEEDVADVAAVLSDGAALDVYVLPSGSGTALIEAREKAFWTAKASGANDILDMVVPRASIASYLDRVQALASESGSWIVGCGHAGDGNVHFSVFQADDDVRYRVLHDIFVAGLALGGAISGEHGIGSEKKHHFVELEDPSKLALLRRIKTAFDPAGILNPGAIFD
ncbi:MAG TPA: FAD-binding oxidoreductase [Acidimicrobiales bacterium]|jgi:glycolate oxidase|nr:FAD-binding oxidoreductase [Acidimicrobiales bacterium]